MLRKRHVPLVLLASMLGAACDPGPEPCVPCRTASPGLRALQGTGWLVRSVALTRVAGNSDTPAAGVDIDGVDSGEGDPGSRATCSEFATDHVSTLDPGVRGIDAALQGMVGAVETASESGRTFQGDLDAAMAEGRIRWAIRVGALDEDEERIELELLSVLDVPVIGADGRPTAGQALRARPLGRVEGLSYGETAFGRIETEELPVGGEVLWLPFDQLRVAGIHLASEAADGTVRAVLGGSFPVDALVDVAERDGLPGLDGGSFTRSLLESVADLEPSADPAICERVSVGFELEAVPVELLD